jgi:hypothetical protein
MNDLSFRVIVVWVEMQDLRWIIESVGEITILIVAYGVDGVLYCFRPMSLLLCLLLLELVLVVHCLLVIQVSEEGLVGPLLEVVDITFQELLHL